MRRYLSSDPSMTHAPLEHARPRSDLEEADTCPPLCAPELRAAPHLMNIHPLSRPPRMAIRYHPLITHPVSAGPGLGPFLQMSNLLHSGLPRHLLHLVAPRHPPILSPSKFIGPLLARSPWSLIPQLDPACVTQQLRRDQPPRLR